MWASEPLVSAHRLQWLPEEMQSEAAWRFFGKDENQRSSEF
jgi:hypothetical protein